MLSKWQASSSLTTVDSPIGFPCLEMMGQVEPVILPGMRLIWDKTNEL